MIAWLVAVLEYKMYKISLPKFFRICLPVILLCMTGVVSAQVYDIVIRNGIIVDGSGSGSFTGDVAIQGDRIAAIETPGKIKGTKEIDATGLVVSPGFINMLSWADAALVKDGRSMSNIKQGVTMEIFGEGWSPGPRKSNPKKSAWGTLGEFLAYAEKKGVSPNIASFVGATTVRMYVLGAENRAPSPQELEQMKNLVRQAMKEGAMGLGTSLIYAPADFASTHELTELAKAASEHGGMYITHMRSESDQILNAMDEAFAIARDADIPAEIYHLKINHQRNWGKIDRVLKKIDSARNAGLKITANMYPYTASSTGLTARLPTWVQEGGMAAMRKRLRDPSVRTKVLKEMELGIPSKNSDPSDVLILSFHRDSLNALYKNMRLDRIAALHGKNPDETVIDLIIADRSSYPIPTIYFLMLEQNVRRMISLPYVSIGSDATSMSNEPHNVTGPTHPRLYGSFARFYSRYVREEKLMSPEEGIRRMTSMPAENLKIKNRGLIQPGYYADIAIFDPEKFRDRASYEDSHLYAEGMVHVLVNGTPVLANGEHTGKTPGRAIRGPGYKQSAVLPPKPPVAAGKQ